MATPTSRKRGRPKGTTKQNKSDMNTGVIGYVRDGLGAILKVCPNCGNPESPVAPLANELGVTPQTLAAFLRGKANVQLDTFNRLYEYVENWKHEQANPAPEATEVASA